MLQAAIETYPERWLNYMEARDVYRVLPYLHGYAREWLELVEIFASFPVLDDSGVNVALCPPQVAQSARYSTPILVNPRVMPNDIACFCCVPQYTRDILREGYDVSLLQEALDLALASLLPGGNFVCKIPPENYSSELFDLLENTFSLFFDAKLVSPSIGSPYTDCRYLVCLGNGSPVPGRPSSKKMRQHAIDERRIQEEEMMREFLGTVDYPQSKVLVDTAALDWNRHAHLLRRATK